MALRELVTGTDVCTPGDGAGPSNAAGALADTLLGRGAKTQQRLRELPGVSGTGAGPSVYGAPQAPSVSDFARAAVEGGTLNIPGVANSSTAYADAEADAFLWGKGGRQERQRQQQQQPDARFVGDFAGFEEAYREGAQRPPTPFPHQMLLNGDRGVLQPFLQAFMESGRLGADFRPLRASGVVLTVADQCRVRDRSTIMARHLYADLGDQFADAQVGKLLQSLSIDAEALPAVLPGRGSWGAIYDQGVGRELMPSMELAAAGRAAAQRRPEDLWAQEFQGMGLQERHLLPGPSQEGALVAEFAAQQARLGPPGGWAEQFQQQQRQQQVPGADWASDFNTQQVAAARGRGGTDSAGATLAQTKALAQTLASDPNPKVQKSQFLQFLSKMSRGELILEDNQVKARPPEATGAAWAGEFSGQQPGSQQWAADYFDANPAQQWLGEFGQQQSGGGGDVDRWADDFANDMSNDAASWGEQYNANAEEWIREYGPDGAGMSAATQAHQPPRTRQQGYLFAHDNPFADDADSFAKGKDLFRRGVLSEAALALEAEVQRSPRHVDAWRLLGTVHAENDDDVQAIAAMERALEVDPGNLEVLLSLGVSHTNELDQSEALSFLHRWLRLHPAHGAAAASAPGPPDSSQRQSYMVGLFEAAARAAPGDADMHAALGVLHNLGRTYTSAVAAFRQALATKPQDYSLWNKLGATLANSTRSEEAISAYQQALELKPNYMRAWTNMGISQANVGRYDLSSRYYVRALGLNPRADNVWGYLRTSLSCAGKLDLLPAVEAQDLSALQGKLPLS